MNKIFKYPIEVPGLVEVELPQGARILSVHVQERQEVFRGTMKGLTGEEVPLTAYGQRDETVCLWAMSNTDESRKVRRMFRVYGTGKPIQEDPAALDYIGTVQTGSFVWHVFERNVSGMKIRKVQ